MELREIIGIADATYPGGCGLILDYYARWETTPIGFDEADPKGNHGDTLAKFIASEIGELYDSDLPPDEQLREIIQGLQTARDQLDQVIAALHDRA